MLLSVGQQCDWQKHLCGWAGARANPMMAVCGNTLWMLGGVVEVSIHFPSSCKHPNPMRLGQPTILW